MEIREYDFLVIGSGIAGLFFTLKVSNLGKVALITKKAENEANTNYAQGGIASVFANDDNYELHIQDTINAGQGLCNEEAVKIMVKKGPRLVEELAKLGTHFDEENGHFLLGMEGGHSKPRIVHAKDYTGKEIENTLIKRVGECKNVDVYINSYAIDLIVKDNTCYGGYIVDIDNKDFFIIKSSYTLLATGGIGAIYLHTTNPSIATGDGIAMALKNGAILKDMEFVQFHPTSLYENGKEGRSFLISEAVRGEGAKLRLNEPPDYPEFMYKYDERKELAPRDIVARAIDMELKKSGKKYVLLDFSPIKPKRIKERFPNIYNECKKKGYDITKDMIPVVPAAHYICGGVATDIHGKTTIKRLFAAGEVAHTGVHGSNRLASNSLLEALVFSYQSAEYIKESFSTIEKLQINKNTADYKKEMPEKIIVRHLKDDIKRIMWDYVGIVRSTTRLNLAWNQMKEIYAETDYLLSKYPGDIGVVKTNNMATVSLCIIKSALERKESRGLHYMIDYPERDDVHFKHNITIRKGDVL